MEPSSFPDEEQLRLRLSRGDGLCFNEHTINTDDGDRLGRDVAVWWITCDGKEIARTEFTREQLVNGEQRFWGEVVILRHRAHIAEQVVSQILDWASST